MRVVVHPADQGGCGFYRLIAPSKALIDQGEDVTLDYGANYKAYWQSTIYGEQITGLAQPVNADVVVLQRPLTRNRYELLRAIQAAGPAVVVEVDDNFHAIHRLNVAWQHSNPLHDREKNRDWLLKSCEAADWVTVTTPALAEQYGGHGRVSIVPNYVPAAYCALEPGADLPAHLPALTGTVLGWTGSVATHPDDLQATGGGVARVLNRAPRAANATFHVVGTGAKVAAGLGLVKEPTATGWLPLGQYPAAMAQIDVGIVPLADHRFNEAKSWLKGLEFAALGVPFVASPTGPYRELAGHHGLGVIARDPGEWCRGVEALVLDPVFREDTALRYRETVETGLTVELNAWRWLEAWSMALERRAVA